MTNKWNDYPDDEPGEPSKTQIKQAMRELQNMAVELTKLKPEQLATIPLTPELERALAETKKIKKNEALRRHHQYLGRLMRNVDHEAIQAALTELQDEQNRLIRLSHAMEHWRDQLIEGDETVLQQFIDHFPQVDRQHLRQLVRNAKDERQAEKPPANGRKLFRFIRETVGQIQD